MADCGIQCGLLITNMAAHRPVHSISFAESQTKNRWIGFICTDLTASTIFRTASLDIFFFFSGEVLLRHISNERVKIWLDLALPVRRKHSFRRPLHLKRYRYILLVCLSATFSAHRDNLSAQTVTNHVLFFSAYFKSSERNIPNMLLSLKEEEEKQRNNTATNIQVNAFEAFYLCR